jgi:hypothetical protein
MRYSKATWPVSEFATAYQHETKLLRLGYDSILLVGRRATVALAGEAKFMKATAIAGLLLMAAFGVSAQEQTTIGGRTNAAAMFGETSAAQVKLVDLNLNSGDAAAVTPADAAEASADPAATPDPAPVPKYIFGERDDYRFQLGVGFDFVRYNSNQFDANLVGVNTSLTYYTNAYFGAEGQVVTGFSTGTYAGGAHAKLAGGLGGIHIGGRRARWEPFAHALVGGSHLQPHTAGGGRTSLMALAGGGVDYRVHARLSFRFEGDWAYTRYFNQNQNNFQLVAGAVLHF